MRDPELQNEHYIKLTGKGNIPESLHIGHNYEINTQGTIVSATEEDKNNGQHIIYYKFQPVIIEIKKEKGEAIKAKDTRSMSQIFRARVWKYWTQNKSNLTFEEYYEHMMQNMIQQAPEICEMYGG